MSVLEECKRNFKMELRRFVGLHAIAANPADIQRQRGRLRQLLTDVRCGTVAMLSVSPSPIPPASVDQKRRPGKDGEKRAAAAAASRLTVTASVSESASSTQMHAATTLPSSTAGTITRERGAGSPANRRDPAADLKVAEVFAEECLAGAQYLLARGLYEDVVNVCLDPLEKDVQQVLRGVAANLETERHVERANAAAAFAGARDFYLEDEDEGSQMQASVDKTMRPFGLAKPPKIPKEMLHPWRLLAQYDLLRYICQFYIAFLHTNKRLDFWSEALPLAKEHLASLTSRLIVIAEVDADDSYHILFNGTLTVYEMCLYMMRQAREHVNETIECVIRHIAICLEICESSTLKLATVRYMPWRIRLYDYLAACYEQRGMYSEALSVVQRATRKIQELINLEFLDPVPPPQSMQDIMLQSLSHISLSVMRYTWYANSTNTAGEGKGTTTTTTTAADGPQSPKQQSAPPQALSSTAQQELIMNEMPSNGNELLDRAWQLLLKVELPKRPKPNTPNANSAETTPGKDGKGKAQSKQQQQKQKQKKDQQQQLQEVVNKDLVAQRIWEPLMRFLLSIATASSLPAGAGGIATTTTTGGGGGYVHSRHHTSSGDASSPLPPSQIKQFALWGLEALEFLARYATASYTKVNPDVKQQGLPEEFADVNMLSPRQDQQQASSNNNNAASANAGRKKNSLPRRGNRAQPSAMPVTIPATADEAFLSSITLEHLLYNLAQPSVSQPNVPEDAESSVSVKQHHAVSISEECLLFTLILHRVLYTCKDINLYGRLCTCSISSLLQRYGEDEDETRHHGGNQYRKPSNKKIMGPPPKKVIQLKLLDTVCAALRLLQRLSRMSAHQMIRVSDLVSVAQELEELSELYAGPNTGSVMAILQQCKKDTTITIMPSSTPPSSSSSSPRLGTSTLLSNSFAAICQGLLEEAATILEQHAGSFSPSYLASNSFLSLTSTSNASTAKNSDTTVHGKKGKNETMGGEEEEEEEWEIEDMYHRIVCSYLGAKVNSGLSDGVSIGNLVISYVKEIELQISVSSNSSNSGDGGGGGGNNLMEASSSLLNPSMGKENRDPNRRFHVLDGSMRTLRKKCYRARIGLAAIRMAVACLAVHSSSSPADMLSTEQSCKRNGTQINKVRKGLQNRETTRIHEEKEEKDGEGGGGGGVRREKDGVESKEEELKRIRRDLEIRDMRTELMRWMVKLRWAAAILRQHYAALEKHKSDIKLVMERQANTKVYGATTMKEANILESLLHAQPEAPRVCDDEKGRLLAWSRDEGDELLQALVLMCLAPYQLQTKTQREMLEGAFYFLQRHENHRRAQGHHTSPMAYTVNQAGESAYSALMIWCYAISTCGKLGFNNMTESAKDVLYAAFARSSDTEDDEVTAKEEQKTPATTVTGIIINNNNNNNTNSKRMGATPYDSTGEPTFMFLVRANEEVLAVSSALQLQTLVSALLWLSTVEARRIPYHNFDTTGLMPFSGKSVMLEVPFQQRYGVTRVQLWHMRSAYRIQFAMELAGRVKDSSLMLQCSFELFNTLLPSLTDENYYPFLLPPLATLCEALLQQKGPTWSDAHVQRLAARTLDALLKTVSKMSTSGTEVEYNLQDTMNNNNNNNNNNNAVESPSNEKSNVVPTSIQGWYELLIRLFVHVWENVYNYPNPRQVRYKENVRRGATAVQRLLSLGGGEGGRGGMDESGAYGSMNSTPRFSGIKGNTIPTPAGATPAVGSNMASMFPGGGYAVPDTILDDCVPIEFLELLGAILFTVPGGMALLAPTSPSKGEKSTSENNNNNNPQSTMAGGGCGKALVGVPAWLFSVANALTSKNPTAAFDRLQQASDDPLYAKTAVYIVEYLLREGDMASARRVATDALQGIDKVHQSVQAHWHAVVENTTDWLEHEGFMLVAPSRPNKKTVEEEQPNLKGKGRKGKSIVKETGEPVPLQEKKTANDFASNGDRQWSSAEEQMLRQLTRSYAFVRRRQALAWLRKRILQFNAPYRAQLHFYLSVIAQAFLEHRRQQQQHESRIDEIMGANGVSTRATGAGGGGGGQKTKTRGGGDDAAAAAAMRAEEREQEESFIQHAVRSAILFNRCRFPSRAFATISQAIDGLRRLVCEEPPDLTMKDELLLLGNSNSRDMYSPGNDHGLRAREGRGMSSDSLTSTSRDRNSDVAHIMAVNEKLIGWGPKVLPLARALEEMLLLLWKGFVDYRRDVDFLQPAAVKVGQDVNLEEQLHFQGRIPSLYSYTSSAGQYEETRLMHLSAWKSACLMRSFEWRTRDVQAAEQKGRDDIHLQWLTDLRTLLTDCVSAGVLTLGNSCLLDLEQEITNVAERNTRRLTMSQSPTMPAKTKKKSPGAIVRLQQGVIPEPIRTDSIDATQLIALRFGSTIPAEKVIAAFMFLLRYMQFNCQLASLELSIEVHKLTGGFFAYALLPFTLSMQRTIGAAPDDELFNEYIKLHQNEPMQKVLVRNAKQSWEKYTTTEMYQRVIYRLGRTLLPSKRNDKEAASIIESSLIDNSTETLAKTSLDTTAVGGYGSSPRQVILRNGMRQQQITVRDVISSFETATAYLQERRLFGQLAEQLYELGRIHLLHRQRSEAERSWIEAVDAALEVPDSLRRPAETWKELNVAVIGLPRLLLAIMSLSSLAMYIYREQQGKAVDAYLLASRILEHFFKQGATSNFPQRLRDFGGFMLEDLIVLPQLGDTMPTLMPQVVHHMLFLAWELLRFKFPFYAAMVASFTEYLARTYMRHVASTVEARLVQAMAASKFGSYKASMKILRDVCQGVRIPRGAMDGTALCLRPLLECADTAKTMAGTAAATGGGKNIKRGGDNKASSSYRQTDTQADQHQQQHELLGGLYEDSELPVTPGNIASVQTFLTQCFSAGSVSTTASNLPPQHASPSSHAAAPAASSLGGGGNSLLRESLAACYGSHLSRRVELTVADFLVTLGSKEAAYVWCASSMPSPQQQQQQQQLRPVSSDRRSGRSRSLQRVTLQSFSGSACIEALNAAEQILQYLLIRVQDNIDNKGGNATHTTGDTNRKRSPGRERGNPTTTLPANSQTKRDREVEDVYIRCTAELLLARIFTAKGESSKALTILSNLVKNFNERMECNTIIPAVTGAPSYLWTVGTHIFWCDVYELMVLNHVRIREYIAAKQVISDALALCERCGDARSGRVFSLYDAAITARSGNTTKATETLSLLQKVSHSLRSDNRMDMFYAWTVIAAKSLKRVAKWYGGGGREHREISFSSSPTQPQLPHSSSLSSLSSVETLELAARELQGYCEMYGLLPGCVPFLETKRLSMTSTTTTTLAAAAAAASTSQRWLLVAWNVEAIFLHTALNLLAEEYIRLGKLELAEGVLEHIISVVAPQYDTSAHPTLLIESQFRLARVLCLLKPQLITEQRKSDDQEKEVASEQQELSTDDLLNKLDAPRKKPIQLLMDVVENIVTRGTHDYNILRLALLYLSVLLSRAERSFHIMASTCLILAKFVVDMNFHVFSGTSIFSLYGEENIQLGIDLVLSESITAVIHSTQRSLGKISENDVATATTIASTAATTTSGGGSGKNAAIEAHRPSSRSRDEANLKSGLVTLPNIVSAFASLHLERSLQYVFPPLESLDLETALQHIRAYLQTKTAPLTGYYLWYDELTRETVIRQQQQQQPQQHSPGYGRLGETMRTQQSSLVATDATGATLSLLPPIVVDKLPPLLSASTLAQLGIPRVNTVICQSFVCDVNNRSISGKSTKQHAAAQHRPGGGNKKQHALTSSTATRSTQLATNTLITTTTTTTNNNNNSSPSSVMNTSGMMTFVLFVSPVHDPTVTQPPPLNEKTQPTQNKKSYRAGLKNTVSSMDAKSLSVSTFSSHPWSGTCCVMFELPVEELQTLLEKAVQTLQMMQTPSTTVVVSSGADNEEQQEVPIEAVLSQRLSEAMVLLTAKAAPPSSGKKLPRSAANTEVVLSSTLSQSANTALSARQGPFSSAQTENVTAALFPTEISATDAPADVVPAMDEAKSKLVTDFIELIVRSVVPRSVTDDDLMEHCVQSLFPRCAVTVEVVRFLRSMAANDDGGAISLFHPGLHEWFLRVAKFVMEYS